MADDPRDDIIQDQNERIGKVSQMLSTIGSDLKQGYESTRDNLKKLPGVLATGAKLRFISGLKPSPLELAAIGGVKYLMGIRKRVNENRNTPPTPEDDIPQNPMSDDDNTGGRSRPRRPTTDNDDDDLLRSEDIADRRLGDDFDDGDEEGSELNNTLLQEISDKLDALERIESTLKSSEEIQLETYSTSDKILDVLKGDPLQEYEDRREARREQQQLLTASADGTGAAGTPAGALAAAGGGGLGMLGQVAGGYVTGRVAGAIAQRGGVAATARAIAPRLMALTPALGSVIIPVLAAAGLGFLAYKLFDSIKEGLQKTPEELAAETTLNVEQAQQNVAAAEGTIAEGATQRQLDTAEQQQAAATRQADRMGVEIPEENRASNENVLKQIRPGYDSAMEMLEIIEDDIRSDPTNADRVNARAKLLPQINEYVAEAAIYGGNFEAPKSNEEFLNEIRNNRNVENIRSFQNIEAAQSREIEADIAEQRREETQDINERLQQESQGLTAERYELTQREMGEAPIQPERMQPRPGQSLEDFQMEQYGVVHRYERAVGAHAMHNLPVVERIDTPTTTPEPVGGGEAPPIITIPPSTSAADIGEDRITSAAELVRRSENGTLTQEAFTTFMNENPDYIRAGVEHQRESGPYGDVGFETVLDDFANKFNVLTTIDSGIRVRTPFLKSIMLDSLRQDDINRSSGRPPIVLDPITVTPEDVPLSSRLNLSREVESQSMANADSNMMQNNNSIAAAGNTAPAAMNGDNMVFVTNNNNRSQSIVAPQTRAGRSTPMSADIFYS